MSDVIRPYTQADVERLRGTLRVEHTFAAVGSKRLRHMLSQPGHVSALGALTGMQAVQMVRAGMRSIYLSGWQVAADANLNGQTYPDQSLYAANSVPNVVARINAALQRQDQIDCSEGRSGTDWFVPIVADAEAGFGGPLNAFELTKAMVAAGAAGIHYEDQLSSAKKCGHLGGKVLIPTSEFIRTLVAARLAADVCDVPTVIVARTDADSAQLITSDIDERDRPFIDYSQVNDGTDSTWSSRTIEGFYRLRGTGMDRAVARALAYAPYADMLWFETSKPDLTEAEEFATRVHERFPGKWLAYNMSPSFGWRKHLDQDTIDHFSDRLGDLGYKYTFITLAGFHALNHGTFELARGFSERGMAAYVELQDKEIASTPSGFTAVKHQHEVGTGYFDEVQRTISGGEVATLALEHSTEKQQF